VHVGAHPYSDVAQLRVVRVDGRGVGRPPSSDGEAGDARHVVCGLPRVELWSKEHRDEGRSTWPGNLRLTEPTALVPMSRLRILTRDHLLLY